ncbi:hypothetical protein AAMO2058_000492400 [Amorphochlora amoebiformis]
MASEVPEIVLDGLPYIDKEYSNPALKSLVDKMVKEEMRSFRPPDYLASMPMPDTRQSSVVVRDMFDRKSAPPKTPFNSERYQVIPPKSDDIKEWKAALKRAQTALEHQTTRVINLELMKRYGSNSWRAYADILGEHQEILSKYLKEQKHEIREMNRKRKASQLAVAPQIQQGEKKWFEYAYRNNELQVVCLQLEKQVKKLRRLAAKSSN